MMERGQPRLLVIAGPNGAGKTTVTERGLAHIPQTRPNPDSLKINTIAGSAGPRWR